MTNRLSFKLENKQHTCYFAMAGWPTNFCHGFSASSGHLQFKNAVSMKKVSKKFGIRCEKMAAWCKEKLVLLYSVMAAQASYIVLKLLRASDNSKKRRRKKLFS